MERKRRRAPENAAEEPKMLRPDRNRTVLRLRRLACLAALLLGAVCAVSAHAYRVGEVPNVQLADARRYVSNPDGILSEGTVARIDRICDSLRRAGTAEVAVVALREIEGEDVFEFAHELFSTWGVGRADGNNGLGILLVEGLHEIRFVTGYGLEGVLPDAVCKRIQTVEMLPAFRLGDYDAGMTAGVEAVALRLSGADVYADDEEAADEVWWILGWAVGVPLLFVGLLWYFVGRCPRCHRRKLRLEKQEVIRRTATFRTTEYTYVCRACGAVVRRKKTDYTDTGNGTRGGGRGGMWLGGTGGLGGFGGGSGGGFGGGHFGGGGAGSRW